MPANCNLEVKQLNPEIWSNIIGSKDRSTDIQIQKSQKLVSKATYVILKISNSTIDANINKNNRKKALKPIIQHAKDGLAFTATSQVQTEKLRRELVLKKLSQDQRFIGKNVPVDDKMLFRDNLNKKLEASGLSKLKPRRFKTSSTYTSASRSRYSRYSKNDFRSRKTSSRGRKGGYNNNNYKQTDKKKDN